MNRRHMLKLAMSLPAGATLSGFVPASSEMLPIYLLLAIVGCLVGAAGAGVAVTRFLDV